MTHDGSDRPGREEPITVTPARADKSNTTAGWLIGLGAFALVFLLGLGSFYATRMLGSSRGASLQAIPGDADMVFSIDLTQVTDGDRIDRLTRAFAEPLAAAGHIESADVSLAAAIDEELQSELGITLEGDVLPWIGGSVSLALWAPSDASLLDSPEMLVSLDTRDHASARAFIDKLFANSGEQGIEFETSTLAGGDLFSAVDIDEGHFWLGDDLLLAAGDIATIQSALDARSEGSILDNGDYGSIVDKLPADSILETYIAPGVLEQLNASALAYGALGTGAQLDTFEGFGGMGFAVSLTDAGIRMDSVQTSDGDSPWFGDSGFDGTDLVDALPESTIAFLGYRLPEGYIDQMVTPLRDLDPQGFEDTASGFEQYLGVDLFEELLPSLGSDMLLAVTESSEGAIAAETGVPLGLLFSLELLDPAPLTTVATEAVALWAQDGVVVEEGSPTVIRYNGQEVAAYEIGDDLAVIGTSRGLVADFLSGGSGLTGSELYRELDAELDGDGLSVYVDIGRIVDMIPMPADERAIFAPVRGLGGTTSIQDGAARGSALILVDY